MTNLTQNQLRKLLLTGVKTHFDQFIESDKIFLKLIKLFVEQFDVEQCADTLCFESSHAVLSDKDLGREIIEQTDVLSKFYQFVGVDNPNFTLNSEDELFSGQLAKDLTRKFVDKIKGATSIERKWIKVQLAYQIGSKFKKTDWWEANKDKVSKLLKKNRKAMRLVISVQEN